MLNRHAMADKASALLFEKARPRLKALLAEYGTSDPNQLPRALQSEICRRAILGVAAANFPTADLQLLSHGLKSFDHPAFIPALERMTLATKGGSDAFAMTRGVYAAVVLAAFGLPVAPYDLMTTRILAQPSNEIDTVLELFSRDKGALVGYDACTAPFYVLLTDCVRTLRWLVPVHPELSEVKLLLERNGTSPPTDPGQSFMHGVVVIGRRPGDKISNIGLFDPNPQGGSVMLYAGWQVDGEPYGAPNDGYMPVPVQLLRAVVHDPELAYSLSSALHRPSIEWQSASSDR
jgi:hypothetical protein